VKAVIIAGGFGTRLRPLSCTRPKHLFPIGGKLLLDWTLGSLADAGVREVIFAVNYMSEAFVKRYGKSAYGMKMRYSRESKPLGTGGCIKNAEKIIGHDNDFILLNGDIVSNVNYLDLLRCHAKNGGAGTIVLHEVGDPSRYGVVELEERNRIKRFVEKPPPGKAPSRLINAGVYALSPRILGYISSKRQVSIERQVFPLLAQDGELFGYEFKGMWLDIGEPTDFLKGNKLLLNSELKKSQIAETATIDKTAQINRPVAIGDHTGIGGKSTIGPHVMLCENVAIGNGVHIENSVIFPGTIISDFSCIEGAIIGEEVFVGKHVRIIENCLIGDHATIHDGARLSKGVTVCPYREVAKSARVSKCLM
jgi:NDP-sugar pyrophosphorylase family protein